MGRSRIVIFCFSTHARNSGTANDISAVRRTSVPPPTQIVNISSIAISKLTRTELQHSIALANPAHLRGRTEVVHQARVRKKDAARFPRWNPKYTITYAVWLGCASLSGFVRGWVDSTFVRRDRIGV